MSDQCHRLRAPGLFPQAGVKPMKPRLLGVHTLNAAPKTKDTGRVAGFLVQTSSRRRRPRRPRERRPGEISKGERGGENVGRSFLKERKRGGGENWMMMMFPEKRRRGKGGREGGEEN